LPEPLPDGGSLMICGGGVGAVAGTTVAVDFFGQVFIEEQRKRRLICSQTFPLTFRRAAANATSR
jgi:hypothetical protein